MSTCSNGYVTFKIGRICIYKFHLVFAPVNLMTRVEEGDSGLDETTTRGKLAIYVLNFLEVSDSISVAFIRGLMTSEWTFKNSRQ